MFLINFNQWKYACVGINNLVISSEVSKGNDTEIGIIQADLQ